MGFVVRRLALVVESSVLLPFEFGLIKIDLVILRLLFGVLGERPKS